MWALGGVVADSMSCAIRRSYGADIEAHWCIGRYVLQGNVQKVNRRRYVSRPSSVEPPCRLRHTSGAVRFRRARGQGQRCSYAACYPLAGSRGMRRGWSAHQCQIGLGSCGTCGLLFPGRGALRWHGDRGNYCQDFSLGCEPMMICLTVHPAIGRPDFVSALAYAVLKVLIHERLSRRVAVWRPLHRRAYLRKGKSRGSGTDGLSRANGRSWCKSCRRGNMRGMFSASLPRRAGPLNSALRAARRVGHGGHQ
jgi:hypothetical protein